jgi:hypothetical protein
LPRTATLHQQLRQLRSDLSRVQPQQTAAFAAALPRFLRERVSVQDAEERIKRQLDVREDTFLEQARARVYDAAESPYRRLLEHAGCAFADLEGQVRRHGLESALEQLARAGVYLTSDEFKGKTAVVRGSLTFRISPRDFEPAKSSAGFGGQSSGTRNDPVRSFISLDWLAERTSATAVAFSAHDLFPRVHAMYDAILPAAAATNNLLMYAKLGVRTDRWFARKMPVNSWLEGRYHLLLTWLMVLAGKRFGPGYPAPRFIDTDEVHRIVRWVLERRRAGRACCITTAASNAARIGRVAWEMGASLEGTKFIVSGEPFTDAKRQVIERVGGTGISRYAYGGSLNIGFGCAEPRHIDEIHVNQHLLALLLHPKPLTGAGPAIRPLLCTTLNPLAPHMLLNVENGDYGILEERGCGCHLGRVGLWLRVHRIRSFEKLASEGMNYDYTATDLFELLEGTLPAEFGGGPGDYQLAEEEDDDGQTRLTLRVHPDVPGLDEARLLARLQERLAAGSRRHRFMAGVWQAAGTLRVRREVPHASPRGKILPLHIPPPISLPPGR